MTGKLRSKYQSETVQASTSAPRKIEANAVHFPHRGGCVMGSAQAWASRDYILKAAGLTGTNFASRSWLSGVQA
jgi:hypothetical protein